MSAAADAFCDACIFSETFDRAVTFEGSIFNFLSMIHTDIGGLVHPPTREAVETCSAVSILSDGTVHLRRSARGRLRSRAQHACPGVRSGASAGFHPWALVDGAWHRVNRHLMPSHATDSPAPADHRLTALVPDGRLGRVIDAMMGGASVGEGILEVRRLLARSHRDVAVNRTLLGDPSLTISPWIVRSRAGVIGRVVFRLPTGVIGKVPGTRGATLRAPSRPANPESAPVSEFKSDIEIARSVTPRPIREIGEGLGIDWGELRPYGHDKAKISLDLVDRVADGPRGRLVLVTAISPTPAGEGKTTTSVGLTDGLNRIGTKAMVCLREPSLGPCFGMKGGAAGGGYAQVIPMEDINLHFTGDFHAITAAHNLLAAMIDNHIYWGNELGFDSRRVTWRRVLDMNDRALREINVSLGGVANGFPRESGFDITVASEVMAIFCLAYSVRDLEHRLGEIIVGYTRDRAAILARDLGAAGPMTVLLKDAFSPNLVQTLEGNPAIIHGGPFANIAHGCNSVVATRTALGLADYVVTEAGFGADLGAEKFFDIKCRKSGLKPDAAVLVATVRALKYHGGVARDALNEQNLAAVETGLANLRRHIQNVHQFGVPVVVAINRFHSDTDEELAIVVKACAEFGVTAVECTHWAEGGAGTEALAREVVELAESGRSQFMPLYGDDMSLWEKVRTVARRIYGAADIIADKRVRAQFQSYEDEGFGRLPVCIAKTQYSFSTDPELRGAPSDHVVPIREVRLSAGAGFVVVICGEIMTMPGLPRVPAAVKIRIDESGQTTGLF